jgi:endonuclease YncB( thermonuclease family)
MKVLTVVLSLATAVVSANQDAGVPPPSTTVRTFKAMAYSVHDGDTMRVVEVGDDNACVGVHNLRIASIDAPETKMPFGPEAKKFTADWVFNKTLTVKVYSRDKYKREVAMVCYGASDPTKCLDHQIIAAGFAWQYTAYSKDERLAKLQAQAKEAKKGLWADPSPQPPWEWRKSNR